MGQISRAASLVPSLTWMLVCALCLAAAGCGGGRRSELVPVSTGAGNTGIEDRAEAADLPVPSGVDPNIWALLTAEFHAVRATYGFSDPPLNPTNQVDDLVLVTAEDGSKHLSWSYHNVGDYDLNGLINASDLTPVGVYYGVTTANTEWLQAQVADGNGDGQVGLGDITPIGQNYGNKVAGYLLESSPTPEDDGSWIEVARIGVAEFEMSPGQPAPRFRVTLEAIDYGSYYRATPYILQGSHGNLLTGIAGQAVLLAADQRGDWWMEGGDNHHSSYSSLVGPSTNHVWWSLDIGGDGKSGPVIDSSGRIYIGGENGLFIIESDGSSFQCKKTLEPVETTPAIAQDGTVYFGCNNGNLYALGPDRNLKWVFPTTSPAVNSPAIADDGTVWFANEAGDIYALAPDSTVVAEVEGTSNMDTSPAIDSSGRVFFSGWGNTLFYYPESGGLTAALRFLWPVIAELPVYAETDEYGTKEYLVKETLLSSQTTHVNAIVTDYFSEPNNLIEIYFPSDYEISVVPPMAGPDGCVYFRDKDSHLLKYTVPDDESNQAVLDWRSLDPIPYNTSRMTVDASGNFYYVNSSARRLVALNPDGSLRWEYEVKSMAQPVIAPGNTLLVVTTSGELLAFGGIYNGAFPHTVMHLEVSNGYFWNGTLELSWSPANGADSYEIFRDDGEEPVHVVNGPHNAVRDYITWADVGLMPGTTYSYQVQGANSRGTGLPSLWIESQTYLAKPAEFTASQGTSPDSIELSWQASLNATGYRIYRDADEHHSDPVAVLGDVQSWTDTSVGDWDEHRYYIIAFNEIAVSPRAHTTGYLLRGSGDTGPGDWRMNGHDCGHRQTAGIAGPGSANPGWQKVTEHSHLGAVDDYISAPLFGSEGAIYMTSYDDDDPLLALNADGSLRWSAPSTCRYPVILDDGSIATGADGYFTVYNSDGTLKLQSETTAPTSLLIAPDGSLIGNCRPSIVSLTTDGIINWEYTAPDKAVYHESLVCGTDGTIYAIMSDYSGDGPTPWPAPPEPGEDPPVYLKDIHAINPDGSLRWSLVDVDYDGTLVANGADRFYACFDDALNAIDTADGSIIWSFPQTGDLAVNAAGQLILASGEYLFVLESDGTIAWSYQSPAGFTCSYPIVDAAGTIFFNEFYSDGADGLANINRLVALDSSGELTWSYETIGCSGHAAKSIRDDGSLLWFAIHHGESDTPVLHAFGP